MRKHRCLLPLRPRAKRAPVNLTVRLEELISNLAHRILLSARTAELLAGTVRLRDLGPVAIRGFDKPISIFEPLISVERSSTVRSKGGQVKRMCWLITLVSLLGVDQAYGHGGHLGTHLPSKIRSGEALSFGLPGDTGQVSAQFSVVMSDAKCVLPTEIHLRRGQTVRFIVKNSGTRMHELVLGTSHELKEHASPSSQSSESDHEEPYIVHVDPGTTEAIVWRFMFVGIFGYGCLIHGTHETRMSGRITVSR